MSIDAARAVREHPALTAVVAGRREWEASVIEGNSQTAHLARHVALGSVPAELVGADRVPGAGLIVVHVHGGGHNSGSPRTHRALALRISEAVAAPVAVPDLRLAPEHPCPAAVDDAVQAYRHVLRRGIPPGRIVVGGDSSGGGAATAMLVRLRGVGLPAPAAAYLMSPRVDLTLSGASITTNAARDAAVSRDGLLAAAELYLQGHPPDDPDASPLFADLTGLPPLLVQVGGEEILLDDARRLVGSARAAGVDATLALWDGMQHVFQADVDRPEAGRAIADIAAFVGLHIHRSR